MNAPPIASTTRHPAPTSGLAWSTAAAAAAAIGIATLLYLFDPAQHGFYPRCMLKVLTGIDCPGCGGLRATHQLLHGEWRRALNFNPLAAVGVPLAALASLVALPFPSLRTRLLGITSHPVTLAALGGVLTGFTLIRNLPLHSWLNW